MSCLDLAHGCKAMIHVSREDHFVVHNIDARITVLNNAPELIRPTQKQDGNTVANGYT
jgi:hypothetical protein